jgi:hypothetical protein
MGLDMYLYANHYVFRKNYFRNEDNSVEDNPTFTEIVNLINASSIIEDDSWTGLTVQLPIGYWRKANAIHAYIVGHHANSVDDCKEIELNNNDLQDLLDVCIRVSNEHIVYRTTSVALDLLPTVDGFFFGATEYDDWYYKYVDDTINILTKAVNSTFDSFTYRASW